MAKTIPIVDPRRIRSNFGGAELTNPNPASSALQVFGLSNQNFLWMSRLPGMQASRLLRWGTDGLAFIETDAISGRYSLLLLSGSLLGP